MDGQNRAMPGGLMSHDLALAATYHKTPVVGPVIVAL